MDGHSPEGLVIGALTTCSGGVRRFKVGLDLDLVTTKTLVGSDKLFQCLCF
jgi:hypothetical protein